jgi:hypothetical protein
MQVLLALIGTSGETSRMNMGTREVMFNDVAHCRLTYEK